ncbi:MAG: hypothetical protein LC632_08580 [Xanthomonadaceae bacterium]|nr:hypothetical protein [Xanthomonadaceae bacterium]
MCATRWLVVALAFVAACTAPPAPQQPSVEVRELADGAWHATWRFQEPVSGMRFARPARYFREDAWRVLTPGYALARDGDSQVVLGGDAAPVAEIQVEFPVDTRKFPREYEFFHRFSDGSVALYTGMLHAETLDGRVVATTVTVDPGPARALVTTDTEGADGTYAYVGNIPPLHAAHMRAVVDPGLPPWLAYELEQRTETFFALLAERTGHQLERKPLVLFNFVPGERDGYAYRGGALQGLIHLSAVGDGWHDADPNAVRAMLRFIAHEAAHMWNADLVKYRSGSPPWLHEGGADALSERILVAAGIAGPAALAAFDAEALDECTRQPELALSEARSDRAPYACGSLVASWSEQLLQAADPTLDLFDFTGRLIARARAGDGRYGEDDWFAVLKAMGAEAAAVDALQAFVRAPQAAPAWRAAAETWGNIP